MIPILRQPCSLPSRLTAPSPVLYVNLQNDKDADQWHSLLTVCMADLGTTAPDWLRARDQVRRFLHRNQSVNLVVNGNPKWRQLIEHLRAETFPRLGIVDLQSGATASRRAFVSEVLRACGVPTTVPQEPEDLVRLHQVLLAQTLSRLALWHLDILKSRPYHSVEFFAALRHLMMEEKKLVMLAQSRLPFSALLPQDHPLSSIDIQTVELQGRP